MGKIIFTNINTKITFLRTYNLNSMYTRTPNHTINSATAAALLPAEFKNAA